MPDKNSGDLSREVFEQYGRATHAAAEMERCLVNLAVLLEPPSGDAAHAGREGEFTGFFRAWDGKPAPTVDRLAARLGWEAEPLRRAVEIRTYLRDRFWQENSDRMHYFDGRRGLVKKLTRLADELMRLNDRMASEASRLFIRHGLSEKSILEAVDRIVGREDTVPRSGATRSLTACVAFRNDPRERGYVPALQCADGSLLLITRDGLKAGPESVKAGQCVEFLHLSRHFPAVLSGAVEAQGPWSWRVPLGDRMELYVEREKGGKSNAVQWGIRERRPPADTMPEVSR